MMEIERARYDYFNDPYRKVLIDEMNWIIERSIYPIAVTIKGSCITATMVYPKHIQERLDWLHCELQKIADDYSKTLSRLYSYQTSV